MKLMSGLIAVAAVVLAAAPARPSEYIADPSDTEHVPVVVRDVFLDEAAARRAMAADRAFAMNMTRHHQGAVDMAAYISTIRAAPIRSCGVFRAQSSATSASRSLS